MLLRRIQRPRLVTAARPRASAASRHAQVPFAYAHTPLQFERFTQQHRLLWSRASDLMSWMGLKPTDTRKPTDNDSATAADATTTIDVEPVVKDRKASRRKQPAAVDATSNSSKRTDKRSAATPPPPPSRPVTTVTTSSGICVAVDARSIRDVKRAMAALKRYMRDASTSSTDDVFALWQQLRTFKPLAIGDVGVSDSDSESKSDSNRSVLQLLPLTTFVELSMRVQPLSIGQPVSFASASSSTSSSSTDTSTRVVYVSEKTVLRLLLQHVASRKHDIAGWRTAQTLFDAYEHERMAELATFGRPGSRYISESDSESDLPIPSLAQLDEWTRLSRDSYAASITMLVALGDHARVVAFFDDAVNRQTFLGALPTLRHALRSCLAMRRGDLARDLVNDVTRFFPWLVLNKHMYQTAIQACLKSESESYSDADVQSHSDVVPRTAKKTPEQLANALFVYTAMTQDAGYVAYPNLWSTLFNTSVYLSQPNDALAVFRTYKQQCIAPFERRFTQSLRTACKLEQFDLVLDMVHAWVAIEREAARTSESATNKTTTTQPTSILENQYVRHQAQQHERAIATRAERECFNKVLWEMLKRAPTLAQLGAVLTAMESRGAPAGAQVVRLLVARYLQVSEPSNSNSNFESLDSDSYSESKSEATHPRTPMDCMTEFLAVWRAVPRVIERNGFVVHLVIAHCLSHQWDRECLAAVEYAMANRIDLPMRSVVQILEHFETRGDLDAVVALGHKLLDELDEAARARLSAGFFEVVLMSLLRQQAFAKVLALEHELKLTARFPNSDVLQMIVKDATSASL